MKILVAIKRVVDHNVKVRVRSDRTGIDLDNAKMALNPFCEIAVEESVRLKEAGLADEVVVVSAGPAAAQEQIRAALALGADRGVLVKTDANLGSLAVARVLHTLVEREEAQLILLGKQAIDSDNNQTGQMLAALMGCGQGTFASELKVGEGCVAVTREIDGGLQAVELTLPAVVTTDLRLNEPRYASLPNIMKAKRKPLEVMALEDLGVDVSSALICLEVAPPTERQAGIRVASVGELVAKLKNEAGVI